MTYTVKTQPYCGNETAYLDDGSGSVVVLLHGSGPGASALANWRLTIPALSDTHRVIAIDFAGYGGSTVAEDTRFSVAGWVAQTFDVLDALGIQEFSIIGNSLGGRIAMEMALRHPARIERLVLMGSGGLLLQPTPALTKLRQYEPSPEAMGELIRECFLFDASLANEELIDERYRASVASYPAYRRMFTADRSDLVLTPEQIRAIAAPALVVHGRDDRVIPPDNGVMLSQLLPSADLYLLKQCGHWAQFERALDFNAAVRQFIRE